LQLDTYLYIIFNLNIYYLTILCNFFKAKFQSSQLPSVFWREMLNIASCFKLKNNRLINLDFNIDKNIIIIVIMFFFHNRASLHRANRIRVWVVEWSRRGLIKHVSVCSREPRGRPAQVWVGADQWTLCGHGAVSRHLDSSPGPPGARELHLQVLERTGYSHP
jgi:hypothetical protein